ncbi:MAG: thioredoxin domain-containing protein [Verrucomicrobia bacterium]|nr:thioredoxin domain-containing protein [Verrucomicrobiota bacterium]
MSSNTPAHQHTNRLAREKSPYLLQHAHNPVDWFAWGDEAFAKARAENKPIFLSIGYSTCHWCHVMERESFEDEKIGAYLREHFVSIKVDREERPDVDKIYMTFVQSTTGSGGWPLNVFLTPDRKPFFGGTYFPPDDRHGRGSFLSVLQQVATVWRERGNEVTASADELTARLELATGSASKGKTDLNAGILRRAGQLFKDSYDPRHGGFGGAPKFPQPSIPSSLLRYAKRFKDGGAELMVLQTCDKMAAGGIHDQLGGGFARYSVDAEWLVPHFEKMLYDNAQLVQLYLDAHLVAGEKRSDATPNAPALQHFNTPFASVARDILDYVLRDMTHPDGGFYSAEDADSEGQEGKFYCWTHDELSKLLTPEEFNVTARYFGITKQGNFVDHSHPNPLQGLNVLSVVSSNVPVADQPLLASARTKMIAVRAKRIRPHLDDKILASWNGLMLGAFARASAVLGEEKYRAAAEKNVAFVQVKLWDVKSKTLFHRWRDGERDNVQLLEAYAFQLDGVIHLYEATLDPKHLDFAIALGGAMITKFYDAERGGFWQAAGGTNDLILRMKDDYDGAEPSGNSVATLALLKLAAITDRKDFREPAEATLHLLAGKLEKVPQGLAFLLHAVDFQLEEPSRVVVAGDPNAAQAHELIHAAHSIYQPNKVVLGNRGAVEEFARSLPAKDGAVAYVCTGKACLPPTSKPEVLRKTLDSRQIPGQK